MENQTGNAKDQLKIRILEDIRSGISDEFQGLLTETKKVQDNLCARQESLKETRAEIAKLETDLSAYKKLIPEKLIAGESSAEIFRGKKRLETAISEQRELEAAMTDEALPLLEEQIKGLVAEATGYAESAVSAACKKCQAELEENFQHGILELLEAYAEAVRAFGLEVTALGARPHFVNGRTLRVFELQRELNKL